VRLAIPVISLALLAGVFVNGLGHASPEAAQAYHARVREVAALIPMSLGKWHGTDSPVPAEATNLLKPNVMISRYFESADAAARLLVVQSSDARDMGGHYPPNCYPNSGWRQSAEPRHTEIAVGDMVIPVAEYSYASGAFGDGRNRRILDFFVLHPVGAVRDQRYVRDQSEDYRLRHYGAAQFQVIIDGDGADVSERERTFVELLEEFLPRIRAIQGEESVP
jgi:hypothetical protein